MNECLYCLNKIEDGTWCSMACKRLFLISRYDPQATIRTMNEVLIQRQGKKREVMEEIKRRGITVSEYILGDDAKGRKNDG